MAKRNKKSAPRRRRRVGAIGGGLDTQLLIGVAAGAVVGRLVSGKFLANMDPKISSGIQLAAGVFLSMQKAPIVKGAGLGMIGSGAVGLSQSLKLIAGVAGTYNQLAPVDQVASINGNKWAGLNYLGNPQGSPQPSVISGLGNPEGSPELAVIGAADCLS